MPQACKIKFGKLSDDKKLKPTRVIDLVAWAVISATAGYLLPQLVTAQGGSIPISPWNIVITLPLIGIVIVLMAIPMFKYRKALLSISKAKLQNLNTNSPRPKRLNPFYAVRLVLLAKSIAISGAIFTGWHIGVVWLQLSSPIIPSSTFQNALGLIGAIVMSVCALVVERICKITDDGSAEQAPGAVGEPA